MTLDRNTLLEAAKDCAGLPVNHEEATNFAIMKRKESNLARCYIALAAAQSEGVVVPSDTERLLFVWDKYFEDTVPAETKLELVRSAVDRVMLSAAGGKS